jgi:hypothetical protein
METGGMKNERVYGGKREIAKTKARQQRLFEAGEEGGLA